MDPITLLFGFSGRINRAKYWLAVLIWVVAWVLVVALLFISGFSTASIVAAGTILGWAASSRMLRLFRRSACATRLPDTRRT